MQVVILAGGLATRLRPLTSDIPKSMIRINGKPFLEYQLELLKRNGLHDIVLCIGYFSEMIKDYFKDGKELGVNIRYSEEKEKLLGTGGALKNAEKLLDNEFLVMYGDSYLPINYQEIIEYFKNINAVGLMVVYENHNKYDKSNAAVSDNIVVKYDKENQDETMVYIDYGISIFRKNILKIIPQNEFFPLEKVNQKLIEKKELFAFKTNKLFYEIGSFDGLKRFEKYILPKVAYRHDS